MLGGEKCVAVHGYIVSKKGGQKGRHTRERSDYRVVYGTINIISYR